MSPWALTLAIAGLAAITVLTRGFFYLSEREIPIPAVDAEVRNLDRQMAALQKRIDELSAKKAAILAAKPK